MVTVHTAAGMSITVASSVAPKFEGFISDLVASGYQPKQVHCLASSGHVSHSNHYWGGACDFDQTGRGRTAARMYHVADLAKKWGLRDGCTFSDCGHIDVPRNISEHIASRSGSRHSRYAYSHSTRAYARARSVHVSSRGWTHG
jgi:hypothetical protein